MTAALSRFRIEGLHNRYTIDIPIDDNRLILVGENGTGKSTVANFIYLFLTKQWNRIPTSYKFKSITAVIGSEELSFTKEDLLDAKIAHRFLTGLGLTYREKMEELVKNASLEDLVGNRENIRKYALQFEIPLALLTDYIDFALLEAPTSSDKLQKLSDTLKQIFHDRVLYLPTYRRIEQDLTAIFSDRLVFPELRKNLEMQVERLHLGARTGTYIELVEFGMQDVENAIAGEMRELKDGLGAELSKLTSTYLRDVILGTYQSAEPSEVSDLDEATINAVFSRIDQSVLPKLEQQQLREIIDEIKTRHDFQDKDQVAVHFLTKLIQLHLQQQDKEKNVREFVEVCNQYLSRKRFVYDDINFEMSIRLQDLYSPPSSSKEGKPESKPEQLEMSKLSSGEKQIVSLFSQIYLSGSTKYFVIIDEPELSLSVPWQKRFLPDILGSGRCSGLIAATHSPYIFDNALDNYTHSLESFMVPINVTR